MITIYPDKQSTTLQRSAPPSAPNPVPGPQDHRLIPAQRDLTIEVPWLAGNRFHYWLPESIAGTRDGKFDTIDGIQVAADLTLAPIYDYADHIGLMLIAAAPGDANFDGLVDVADLGILGANFNATDMQWDTGDFNLDGMTDVADMGILGANWTASQTTGNTSALVPEPTTLSLLAMSVLVVGRRRRA